MNIKIDLSTKSVNAQTDSDLARLPKPLLINILLYLKSHTDFVNIQRSCKKFYLLSCEDRIWHQRFYPFLFPAKVIHGESFSGAYQNCMDLLQLKENIRQRSHTLTKHISDNKSLSPKVSWWKNRQFKNSILMKDQNKEKYLYHFDRHQFLPLPKGMQFYYEKSQFEEREFLGSKQWILLNKKETGLIYVWNIDTDQLQSLPQGSDLATPNKTHCFQQPRKIAKSYNIFTDTIHNGLLPTLFWQPNKAVEIRIWDLESKEFWDPQFHQYQYRLEDIDNNQDLYAFDFQGEYLFTFYQSNKIIAWNIKTGISYSINNEIIAMDLENPKYFNRNSCAFPVYKDFIIISKINTVQIWNIKNNQLLWEQAHAYDKADGSRIIYGPWLFTVAEDETVNIWNMDTLQKVHTLDPRELFPDFRILQRRFQDGYFIFAANNGYSFLMQTIFLNLKTGKKNYFHAQEAQYLNINAIQIIHSIAAIPLYRENSYYANIHFVDLTKSKEEMAETPSILFKLSFGLRSMNQGLVHYNLTKGRIELITFPSAN